MLPGARFIFLEPATAFVVTTKQMNHLEDRQVAARDAAENDLAAALPNENRTMLGGLTSPDNINPPASPPTQRRSIFDAFWSRSASSNSWKEDRIEEEDDDESSEARYDLKRSPKLEPSYLGVYNFSPTPPMVSRTPSSLSPVSSSKSLTQSPGQLPKSILHHHHSLGAVSEPTSSNAVTIGKSKSAFAMAPLPFLGDTSEESSSSADSERRKSSRASVHFDPTITIREVIQDDDALADDDSNWFSENELRSFLRETVNLCHASALHGLRTYSLSALTKAIAAAHKAGVDDPVMSRPSNSECRSLFSDPILYASDDDVVVHDCSQDFFKVISNEVKSVLIVDNSITTLNLFKRHVLSMFPEAEIHIAQSCDDALKLLGEVNSDSTKSHYDIIIVEENLQTSSSSVSMLHHSYDDHNDTSRLVSGSALLSVVDFIERNSPTTRKSLKIGVSVNLAADCEALLQGGADLFWCKPPPKQSNSLRNQLLNSLLSKRGKNIFICGC
jgi:hypothetical protein